MHVGEMLSSVVMGGARVANLGGREFFWDVFFSRSQAWYAGSSAGLAG